MRIEERAREIIDQLNRLRLELEKAHSYEVPEIIALPIVDGAANYLNWLETELHE